MSGNFSAGGSLLPPAQSKSQSQNKTRLGINKIAKENWKINNSKARKVKTVSPPFVSVCPKGSVNYIKIATNSWREESETNIVYFNRRGEPV